MFHLFRNWRRQRILKEPFPLAWRRMLERNVGWYSLLTPTEKAKLENDLRVFMAEKYWEGCAGLAITDEIKVTIAGQACLLVLGWKRPHYFESVARILVYPAEYRDPSEKEFGLSLPDRRVGEADADGIVVLSWRDTILDSSGQRIGENVVLHEFAHVLGNENGDSQQIPWLHDEGMELKWVREFDRTLNHLRKQIDLRRPTFLDPYAAGSAAELFAVATEAFFELPGGLREHHPELYALLCHFYQQDPAQRLQDLDSSN